MTFNTLARCSTSIKPLSDNSAFTYSCQPWSSTRSKLEEMGTRSEVTWRITRSGIEEANRAHDIYVLRQQKGEPYTARRRRRVLIRNFWKMGMGIISWVYKGSTLTIEIVSCLLLIRMLRFGMKGLFAYFPRGRIIGGDFFPLTAGRTLTFCQRHNGRIDRSKWVRVFKREGTMKKGKGRKCLCLEYEGNLS